MGWYFTTARAGSELDTAEDLAAHGYHVWCGRKVERKRKPEDKHEDAPYLPRYVFLRLSDGEFQTLTHGADGLKFKTLSRHLIPLSGFAELDLRRFMAEVDEKHEADWRAVKAGERLSKYRPGQEVVIVAGPFLSEALVRFAGEAPDGKACVETEIMGQIVKVKVPPENVEAAS